MSTIDIVLYSVADAISQEVGYNSTTTSDLNRLGHALFKPGFFLGVYPAGSTIPKPGGRAFYIQNTEPISKSGSHWLAVALEPGHPPLLFDSYGRTPSRSWMSELQHMDTSDPDVNQRDDTTICGQLCLAFGKIFELHGRSVAARV